VFTTTTRAAAGASSARHSLRLLISEGGTFEQTSRKTGGEIAKLWLFENRIRRVGKGALRAVPTILQQAKWWARFALPTLG
jgi:hypothetical protein